MTPYQRTIPGTNVSFEMVPIPGGVARLRANEDSAGPSRPRDVEVRVEPFWLGRYEVTVAEYNQFRNLDAPFATFEQLKIRKVPDDHRVDAVTAPSLLYDEPPYFPAPSRKQEWPKHPASAMTQYAAKQYTKWLSKLTEDFYRLPSEAEWEYACRAGASSAFSFGDDSQLLADYAWYFENSAEDTHPVGLKKPNLWGLYDMHGNVAEWVLDQYHTTYDPLRKALEDGKPSIHWPTQLHPRTVRGGSWDSDATDCRCDARRGSSVDWQEEEPMLPTSPHWLCSGMQRQIGFRIARPLHPPTPGTQSKYWDADVKELSETVRTYKDMGYMHWGIVDPKLPEAIEKLEK